MTSKAKDTLRIISIVSVCVIAIIAIILRSIGIANQSKAGKVDALAVGLFISSLFVFTAAIIVSTSGRELVGMSIILFSETIPAVSRFIVNSKAAGSKEFGTVIRNQPYDFASIFILVYLLIILALLLHYKAFLGESRKNRKWAFFPVMSIALFVIFFQAVDGISSIHGHLGFILPVISIVLATTFLAYLSSAILSFAILFLVPFHIAKYANTDVAKDGYNIAFWAIGLLFMLGSIAWICYEIYYLVKYRRTELK